MKFSWSKIYDLPLQTDPAQYWIISFHQSFHKLSTNPVNSTFDETKAMRSWKDAVPSHLAQVSGVFVALTPRFTYVAAVVGTIDATAASRGCPSYPSISLIDFEVNSCSSVIRAIRVIAFTAFTDLWSQILAVRVRSYIQAENFLWRSGRSDRLFSAMNGVPLLHLHKKPLSSVSTEFGERQLSSLTRISSHTTPVCVPTDCSWCTV